MNIIELIKSSYAKAVRQIVLNEVIKELENQKKVLTSVNSDELDDAYSSGIDMAIFTVKEMKQKYTSKQ
jgi:lipoate synthase